MNRKQRIEAALRAAFAPESLDVQDDSAQHAGHAGASAEGETHYTVAIRSAAFAGMNRVARSRAVHAVLDSELKSGLHALALRLSAVGE